MSQKMKQALLITVRKAVLQSIMIKLMKALLKRLGLMVAKALMLKKGKKMAKLMKDLHLLMKRVIFQAWNRKKVT